MNNFIAARVDYTTGEFVEEAPSLILRAKVRQAYKLCVAASKLIPMAPPVLAVKAAKTTTDAVVTRKLKLKDLIDQICEDECEFLSEAEIAAAYARYEALMGAGEKPAYDEDPTQDQLSAISHLLKLGLNPYVDFGLFGPTGRGS